MILLDTNLLTRMTRSHDPQSGVARAAIQTLRAREERLIIVPQNCYEFWVVATRPPGLPPAGRNGLGMTPNQAGQWIRFFQRRFTLLSDRQEVAGLWQTLVETHGVTGFRGHDARLVAAMQSYGITQLLTFNAVHFRGMPVTILDPASPVGHRLAFLRPRTQDGLSAHPSCAPAIRVGARAVESLHQHGPAHRPAPLLATGALQSAVS
jgi:predicted nucleic acid-binding protein